MAESNSVIRSKKNWRTKNAKSPNATTLPPAAFAGELEIKGNSTPWTSPINSAFYWPKTETTKVWLPWGNPDGKAIKAEWDREFEWQDPLVSVPFFNQTFNFGMPDYPEGNRGYVAYDGNTISLPMITVSDPEKDIALSVICSPKDRILFENLDMTSFGDFKFSRQYNRISSDRIVKFSADLVSHPAGLAWWPSMDGQ